MKFGGEMLRGFPGIGFYTQVPGELRVRRGSEIGKAFGCGEVQSFGTPEMERKDCSCPACGNADERRILRWVRLGSLSVAAGPIRGVLPTEARDTKAKGSDGRIWEFSSS